ncbi:MAG TPA: hypothetical protein VGG33_05755 [Polyangia bacterium]
MGASREERRCVGIGILARPALGMAVAAFAIVILNPQSLRAQAPPLSINFQPAGSPVPPGNHADSGLTYAARGNGLVYGWNASHATRTRFYPPPFPWMNLRYWTLIEMMPSSTTTWEIAVANGPYQITIGAGGPVSPGVRQQIQAEGILVVDEMPTDYNSWVGGTQTVTVSDGRLTVTNAPGATKNFITFIDIVPQ